ncbi:MAG: hypothetical protein Q8P78_02730 [bacterium]|nr:hypothetical protein [bacterium]
MEVLRQSLKSLSHYRNTSPITRPITRISGQEKNMKRIASLFVIITMVTLTDPVQAENEKFQAYLDNFGVQGLTLGEPRLRARCACDQYGIYRSGKHVADVYPDIRNGKYEFTKYTFVDSVAAALWNGSGR